MNVKNTTASAIVLALLLASADSHADTNGSLGFEGLIEGGTCDLDVGDVDRTVTLPTVRVSDFEGVTTVGAEFFELTAICDSDVNEVTFTFGGTALPENMNLWNNTGGATGVGLRFARDIGGVGAFPIVPSDPDSLVQTRPTVNGRAILPLVAGYGRASATMPVIKGTLVSNLTVEITYD